MTNVLDVLRDGLAARYTVQREIGAGGMATVYLAEEHHPRRQVAIKVLDPALSTRLFCERFVREVDLSSKLSHPHIVPIFSAGNLSGLLYYVMPYIEGESLRHRLMREGRLPLEDALHVAWDVADALAYAHSQGVIHRDIKPENILLSGGHAIVADFGIARAISQAGGETLTAAGMPIGSPAYMSPEQALGSGHLDARTDVYSLGCVLFETLAGEPPVRQPWERLIGNWQALDSAPSLRQTGTGGRRAVKHAVSKALAPSPEDRFATVAEFAAALGGSAHRPSLPTRGVFAGRGRKLALAGAALAVLGVGAAVIRTMRASEPASERVVVAVLENHTGDPRLDNIGHMAADWVTQGLAQTGLVEVVPSPAAFASTTPEGHGAGHLDAAAIRALGKETGARTVVSGAYYRRGDSVRFQVQITNARRGNVLRALDPVVGPLADPLAATEVLRQRVMAALATLVNPKLMHWASTSSQPPDFEAYQQFVEGLERYLRFDWPGAIGHFERAAASDSTFVVARLWSALTHLNVAEYAAADSIAHAVQRAPGRLAPFDRHILGWVLAQVRGDRTGALRAAREAAALAPGSEVLYLVAQEAVALNRPREAAAAFRELTPDRGFVRGWYPYWGDLAAALHMAGDHRRELRAAGQGRERFPELLSSLAFELRALAALGRTEEVRARLAEGTSLPPQPGWTLPDVALLAALELRTHGHEAAAREALDQAARWLAQAPADTFHAEHRSYELAFSDYLAGRLDDAQRRFERLEAEAALGGSGPFSIGFLAHCTGDLSDEVTYLGYLGAIAALKGDRAAALSTDRALQRMNGPYLFGRHTLRRARIHALLGDRDRAVALLQEAIGQGLPYGVQLHTDIAFASLRGYPPFKELLKPKG